MVEIFDIPFIAVLTGLTRSATRNGGMQINSRLLTMARAIGGSTSEVNDGLDMYCGSLSFSITSISFPTCKFREACIGGSSSVPRFLSSEDSIFQGTPQGSQDFCRQKGVKSSSSCSNANASPDKTAAGDPAVRAAILLAMISARSLYAFGRSDKGFALAMLSVLRNQLDFQPMKDYLRNASKVELSLYIRDSFLQCPA
jgi:hypothetical protein